MYSVGSGTTLQVGKESTYGTAVAATKIINYTSESLKVTADKKSEESLLVSKATQGYDLMGIKVAGSTSFIWRPEFTGFLMKAALGGTDTVTVDTPVAGANTHSIVLQSATAALPSYTLICDRKQAVKKYSGCKVDSLELSAKLGDYVKGTINWKAKDESSGSTATLTALGKKAFKLLNGTFTVGGTAYDLSSATFKLSNSLSFLPQTLASGLYLPEPVHETRDISIEWEQAYDTNAETAYTTNFTTETVVSAVVLTLKSPDYVTGTTNYTITITLNNVAIMDITRNVSGAGAITAKFSGKATSVSTTEPLTVSVIDDAATAY